MPFCAKCGANASEGAAFCPACGAAIGGGPAPGPSVTGISSNVGGLLTYIPFVGWMIAIVFLVIEPYKNDKFVRFHAFQSIFFSLVCLVVYWVLGVVLLPAGWVGLPLFWIWSLVRLAILACWIVLMYKAYNNERFMLPIIGPLAAKQAG